MLQLKTALAVILAVSLVLAACGGSGEEATGNEATETPASSVEKTPAEDAAGEAAAGDPMDVAEHIREKTMRMWEVYNTHDLDALKAFYEESYWKEKAEEIRSNMKSFRSFGISITAEETSPPTETAPGKWEIRHTGSFPMGSVDMVFIYEKIGADWLLTYAQDQ